MTKTPSERDCYFALLPREGPGISDFSETDAEVNVIYDRVLAVLQTHFASRCDTDEIREVLSQDPEETGQSHTLVSLFFAQAASDLLTTLIENSPDPTGALIGPIIGVEVPDPVVPDDTKDSPPPWVSVRVRLALYRALSGNEQLQRRQEIESKTL